MALTQNMSKNNTHVPFPFFGAGIAMYYASKLVIRFKVAPDEQQSWKIIASAPSATIRSTRMHGNTWIFYPGEDVHMLINNIYDQSIKENYNVSSKAAKCYEADIERWLLKVHATCPVQFAFRNNTTERSEWHTRSLDEIPALLNQWHVDMTTWGTDESNTLKTIAAGMFDFFECDKNLSIFEVLDESENHFIDKHFFVKKIAYQLEKNCPEESEADIHNINSPHELLKFVSVN